MAEAGANHVMLEGVAERLHFLSRLLGRPSLAAHAIRRDHHARTVCAEAAMHEDFFAGIVADQCEELRDGCVARIVATPRDRDVLHAELRDFVALLAAIVAQVHHDADAQLLKLFEAFFRRLRAAKKFGGDFAEVPHAGDILFLRERMRRSGIGGASGISLLRRKRTRSSDADARAGGDGRGGERQVQFRSGYHLELFLR